MVKHKLGKIISTKGGNNVESKFLEVIASLDVENQENQKTYRLLKMIHEKCKEKGEIFDPCNLFSNGE